MGWSTQRTLAAFLFCAATLLFIGFTLERYGQGMARERLRGWMPRPDSSSPRACTKASSGKCCGKYADFVKPIHTPQPLAALNSSGTREKKCLRVLVVIIFNSPLYDHAPFLRKLYEPFFSSVVFYGKERSAKFNILAAKETPGYLGNFQQIVISQATVEFPGYDGYMWLADDLIFNFKEALPFLNPERLWVPVGYYGHDASPNVYENRKDWHWPSAMGLPAVRKLYKCVPKVFRARSEQWFGGPDRVTTNIGDFGYIPKRFVEDFRILSYSLRRVFMEIAIPTAFYWMSKSNENMETVFRPPYVVYWLWTDEERRDPFKKLTNDTLLLHPVKLYRNPDNQKKLLAKMDKEWNFSKREFNVPWLKCM